MCVILKIWNALDEPIFLNRLKSAFPQQEVSVSEILLVTEIIDVHNDDLEAF